MTFELTFSNLLALCAVFVSALWALTKVIGLQQEKRLNEKFEAIHLHMKAQDESAQRQENRLNALSVDLPTNYVRHEDFTRCVATFHVSVDNLRLTMERFFLEGRR